MDIEEVEERLSTAENLLETAWGIMANAGWDEFSGDVNQEKTEGWLGTVLRWRSDYFEFSSPDQSDKVMEILKTLVQLSDPGYSFKDNLTLNDRVARIKEVLDGLGQ